ncbi:MAG TPA: cytidine deaminase [Fimbriimonadaceae bacterium]|nr:cytidine deaminase [Fimbriimonadaceae bacterium]
MADLIQAAIEARERAYAPYSGYSVGAAILTEQGSIVTGGNVENISYGATICAERSAVVRMLAEGAGSKVCELAVASKDGVTPCGICLQVLQEFAASPQFKVHSVDQTGIVRSCKFQDLLPHPFVSPNVRRTEV